ncbi:uncharacterized protein I303_101952 [Kwoniella dejecticola CBS 10117]|uniref:Xylanolytic transcriptional activator regulatory domain-containing protein n=1 Tax=Kwoniella dejecticola CBS 10117 TaxID=1296121 RepID=A0A1A6ACE0_9TREE|nr:uncharacterized protein I303_01912 [Kwoniella dejecticola CBS 10117]OBR87703.1 hypothetical protein I303_01912 [Kwoniella dejecticola CBS 10117]
MFKGAIDADLSEESDSCTRCDRLSAECTTTQPKRRAILDSSSRHQTSASQPPLYPSNRRGSEDRQLEPNESSSIAPITSPRQARTTVKDYAEPTAAPITYPNISLSAHLATEPRILGFTSLSSLRDEIAVSYGRSSEAEESGPRAIDRTNVDDGSLRHQSRKRRRPNGIGRETQLAERGLSLGVTEQLLSDYATYVSPLNPILLSHEVFSPARMSVVTISAVCAVAALSRKTPTSVFLAAKDRLVNLLDQSDVLKVASVANIQALLIATSKAELLMNQRQSSGGSLSFQRCSSAIRMAQELGLHRTDIEFPVEIAVRRRSAWRSCLIADRWLAAGYGLPQIIDLDDCDDICMISETDPQMILQAELYNASTLLGRVLKEIYTPKVLARTNDDRIEGLIMAIDACRSRVNDALKFGPTSEVGSVVFELSILTVEALFLRGVSSTKIQRPTHVTYRPSPGRWKAIAERSHTLAVWIQEKGDWLLDTSRIGLYGLTFCCLMMFRDHLQTRSTSALHGIQAASRATSRWAEGNGDITHMTAGRQNHAQIIRTLYVVARDGVKGREAEAGTGERLHVVSPLAESKPKRTREHAEAAVKAPSSSSTTINNVPRPRTPPSTELEVSHSLLQLTDSDSTAAFAAAAADVPIDTVNIDTFSLFAFDVADDSRPEEMSWSLPPMDNWLNEILGQEADGTNWNF